MRDNGWIAAKPNSIHASTDTQRYRKPGIDGTRKLYIMMPTMTQFATVTPATKSQQRLKRWALPFLAWAASVLFALLPAHDAPAQQIERRVALIIGNSDYVSVPKLENPGPDARLMAETLAALGFTLVGGKAHVDLDKQGFENVVQSFGKAVQGANVALFYYAGHGLQIRGSNFLVPVNANPTREADADFQLLNVDLVLRQMELAGTRLNMVILDACRNNPFATTGMRSTGTGQIGRAHV